MGTSPKQRVSRQEEGKSDLRNNIREKVDLILPDGLMIFLACIMAPIVLVPIFINLPVAIDSTFKVIDYFILGIFILEYFLKTIFARDVFRRIVNPWHLLDLLIIVLPLVSLLPVFNIEFGMSFPVMRLLRLVRVFAVGGRAIERKIEMSIPTPATSRASRHLSEVRVMNGSLDNVYTDIRYDKLAGFLQNSSHTWIDISYVSDEDLARLGDVFSVPRILLENELMEEAYPRIDYFDDYSMIYARIANLKVLAGGSRKIEINREGILVICQGQNIITLSKTQPRIFSLILEKARNIYTLQESAVVIILYTLLKHILDKDKQIISAFEQELLALENIPLRNSPSNFLEITFNLRKEVNQVVPSLLHLKEIIAVISTKRVPLEGFNDRHEKIFGILMDEANYLHETAVNTRDNLQSLIDLYINTTSHQMNKVMRFIAVFTCLGIIPAIILGALGTNVTGNPWNIHLWQVFTIPSILMVALGWVFYRLGWLKW